MKILVASDLHGSLAWTKKLLSVFEMGDFDKIILLGDLYYHGPRNPLPDEYDPMGVCERLNALADKLVAIRGNCDAEVDQMISDFKFKDEYAFELAGKKIFMSHGQNFNIEQFPDENFDVMFYGHFHVNFIKEQNGKVFVNPGSVSLPKNNTKNSYAIIDENGISVFDFEQNLIQNYDF